MPAEPPHKPTQFSGVMVSSTFADLEQHRLAMREALLKAGLMPVMMEHSAGKADKDLIDSSLDMVCQGSAYILIISHKYGQTPIDPRNSDGVSITELEYEKAQERGLPTLLFLMDDKHPITLADVEPDPAKKAKLAAFRERAKVMTPGSQVHRIYQTFISLDDFEKKAIAAVAELRIVLERRNTAPPTPTPTPTKTVPMAPAFHAEPAYLVNRAFVGRAEGLVALDDWAGAANPYPVLLFEAIGGTGKSMLTWEWVTKRAGAGGTDWAGRFWYSFYEKGAVMVDFCRHALAYITGQNVEAFHKRRTADLAGELLGLLRAKPYLFVLDGLERVLASYHRIDAAQLADEDAGGADEIGKRDPCAAIRPEDDDLLRALAGAAPSKILVTSRLTPKILLNASGQSIPGVQRHLLRGLHPADAEEMFRAAGVRGDGAAMRNYLQRHCDCHPLVIGVLAGLITGPTPKRGDFDAWAADASRGGALNLAVLDLVQNRNNILHAALAAVPEAGRRLLSTLAMLSEAVEYEVLAALNPHLPPEPEEVDEPRKPEERPIRQHMSAAQKKKARADYPIAQQRWQEYQQAVAARLASAEYRAAPGALQETISDLEQRGLLQWDAPADRYDLHPVVRGVAAGGLAGEDKTRFGQQIVDLFSSRPHDPYEQAESLEDLRDGLHVVRILLQMGRYQEAADAYRGDLARALMFNLEEHATALALLRPFFTEDWAAPVAALDARPGSHLMNDLGLVFAALGRARESEAVLGRALRMDIAARDWHEARIRLSNLGYRAVEANRLARADRYFAWALDLAGALDDDEPLFRVRLNRFSMLARTGQFAAASAMWRLLDKMGRDWGRATYRPGDAEAYYALFQFWQGGLTEAMLAKAEQLAREGRNRAAIRDLHSLRGQWYLQQGAWRQAAESLGEAVRLARAVGQNDAWAEAGLALARFHLGELADAQAAAAALAAGREVAHQPLAELFLALGDHAAAETHALAAYKVAWADGEPFVNRYELTQATALLGRLGVGVPDLPPYDPAAAEAIPYEAEILGAIAAARAEQAERKKKRRR